MVSRAHSTSLSNSWWLSVSYEFIHEEFINKVMLENWLLQLINLLYNVQLSHNIEILVGEKIIPNVKSFEVDIFLP